MNGQKELCHGGVTKTNQINNNLTMHDLEIVGLKSATNGRSCCFHRCCGEEVKLGTILRLVKCTVAVDGVVEEAVKCVLVNEGIDGYTVAFVPRVLAKLPIVQKQLNKFVVVTDLYDQSPNKYKKDKSFKNSGMAAVVTLDEEGRAE